MAQVTGGGGKSAVMPNFDPKTFTLKEAISSYAEASRESGSKLEGFEKRLENNKVIQQYLDRPVVDLFDGHWDADDNPLVKLLKGSGEGTQGQLYSNFKSIEDNVFRQISRTRLNEEYVRLTDSVARPAKGAKYTTKFGYNPEKVGQLQKNLAEFVKNNPDTKPVANALLFQLYTGFRPNAAGGLTPENIRKPETRANVHGIFLSGDQVGAKGSTINIPLNRRAMAVLQSQELYNENKFKGQEFIFQKKSKGKFVPIDDKDITGLFAKMKKANLIPKGLKIDVTGKFPKDADNFTSYDLRRLHATTLSFLGVPIEKAALLTGRVIGDAGEQARYIGVAPGVFNEEGAIKDANKLTGYMYGEYSRLFEGGTEAAEKGKFLSLNRDIFSPNEPIEYVDQKTDLFKGTYGKGTTIPSSTVALGDTATKDFEISDSTRNWLRDNGFIKGIGTLATGLGVASIASEVKADYDKYREQGRSPIVSGIGAAVETAADIAVEGGTRAVSMLPSMIVGSSSPAGDTPDRTGYRDPIMEKQMADAKKIPDTANPDTLPNEALKVIQEDADMTNTDLDPEAGFISQADIDANQQMGSPTSQGFMSKYGENDQDLLQTT
jgi:integrase